MRGRGTDGLQQHQTLQPTYPGLVLGADADQRAQRRQHQVGLARVQQALQELDPVVPEDLLGSSLLPGQHHQVLRSLRQRKHRMTWARTPPTHTHGRAGRGPELWPSQATSLSFGALCKQRQQPALRAHA